MIAAFSSCGKKDLVMERKIDTVDLNSTLPFFAHEENVGNSVKQRTLAKIQKRWANERTSENLQTEKMLWELDSFHNKED
jgi:hypothetical protein